MRNIPPHQIHAVQSATDQLVPDPIVAEEFGGITLMTLYRWTNDPKLGFPPPIKIRSKNFRSRRALEDFKARMMRSAVSEHEQGK
jgi:predicted DNA-binding transcriptional regulator AlpA